jgi:hypothetical protein
MKRDRSMIDISLLGQAASPVVTFHTFSVS